MDIITIRDRLNEEMFEQGKRRVCIGFVSELFADLDDASVSRRFAILERDLKSHDLSLQRGSDDPDELYVEQKLKYAAVDMSWVRDAVYWTSRVTTVALEMVVLGILGVWADQRLSTDFLGIVGLLIGVPLGIWHLLRMTQRKSS
ncbi:MAG: hypothetical protein CMJ64_24075 [Planctomycetaceae bacterium]|jgi:hypothetical protein|nr:hypothetical protein [Planctomycetaceae bacterium]